MAATRIGNVWLMTDGLLSAFYAEMQQGWEFVETVGIRVYASVACIQSPATILYARLEK